MGRFIIHFRLRYCFREKDSKIKVTRKESSRKRAKATPTYLHFEPTFKVEDCSLKASITKTSPTGQGRSLHCHAFRLQKLCA